jgi:predicted dienelactone hydrolase
MQASTVGRFLHRYRGFPVWLRVALGLWTVPLALTAAPVEAAERIYLSFGALEQSVAVESLATYARTGVVPEDLKPYSRYLSPEQMAQMRQILQTRVDLGPVAVSQFLYSSQGELLLHRLGEVIQTESSQSGFLALRSALILASQHHQGLTPLNTLRQFPLETIRVDLKRSLLILSDLERSVNQTRSAISAIQEQAVQEAQDAPATNFTNLPDLRLRGPHTWRERTLKLIDPRRNRPVEADIYLPQTANRTPLPTPPPLIVISHGLGSNRKTFAYLAKQLASYGFAVAVPEHPGSNTEQLEALLTGRTSQVTEPGEFINRPLDVKFLLDELERLSHQDPRYRGWLNPRRVGVVGQSMGGYTALALAGATMSLPQLTEDCANTNRLNLSLLLQCRVLELTKTTPDLRDDRVKVVLSINSLGSSLLGENGYNQLNVPVMLVASGADTVTPALTEQIRPFTWLTTPHRYLLLLQNGTHFSAIDVPSSDRVTVSLPPQMVGPNPAIAHRYLEAITVAFFGTYLNNAPQFSPYLSAAYARRISQPELPLSLVRSLSMIKLATDQR